MGREVIMEAWVERHPIITVLGFFLVLGSSEKVVPLIADPLSHTAWRICQFILG